MDLSGRGPLAGLLSAEGMEAEDYTNPDRLLYQHPPLESMTPPTEPGVVAPPIMPSGRFPGARMEVSGPAEAMPSQHPVRMEYERLQEEHRDRLTDFLNRKAGQMQLPPERRIQPRPGDQVIDTDYATPAPEPEGGHPDLRSVYPRHDQGGRMPLNDRTRVLIDNAEAIAQQYAQYIRDYMRRDPNAAQNTGRFYRVDGPIYRAARKYGLSHDEAMAWLNDFSNYMAATSPRTQTEPNARNASLAMAKQAAGIPFREILGPGTVNKEGGGLSEAGYPMMTSQDPKKPGIHGMLLDDVISGEGISHDTNTKPSIFAPNMRGNRSGVTVDTHIIRGELLTLNDILPGSIPIEWFSKEYLKKVDPQAFQKYQAMPETLTSDMLNDKLQTAKVGPKGRSITRQVEYPVFADILHRVARILRVPQRNVADVQSLGWFGMGHRTNLGSNPLTAVDILNQRISVTAQMMGLTTDQVARMLFTRQIPLASLFGAAAAGAGMLMGQPDQAQAAQTPADDLTASMMGAPKKMSPEQFQALIGYMRNTQAQPGN